MSESGRWAWRLTPGRSAPQHWCCWRLERNRQGQLRRESQVPTVRGLAKVRSSQNEAIAIDDQSRDVRVR